MADREEEEDYEHPQVVYNIPFDKLNVAIAKAFGVSRVAAGTPTMMTIIDPAHLVEWVKTTHRDGLSPEAFRRSLAMLFTRLRKYEDQETILDANFTAEGTFEPVAATSEEPFYALFYIYALSRYKYIRLRLGPSTISGAGTGVYAVDPIPKNAIAEYTGLYVRKDGCPNMYYSWTIKSYGEDGLPDEHDKTLFYRDSSDPKTGNWTRYVNCGLTRKDLNFSQEQVYGHVFYVSNRAILADEELFIDYGPAYRKKNLGMKGKY